MSGLVFPELRIDDPFSLRDRIADLRPGWPDHLSDVLANRIAQDDFWGAIRTIQARTADEDRWR